MSLLYPTKPHGDIFTIQMIHRISPANRQTAVLRHRTEHRKRARFITARLFSLDAVGLCP